MAESTLKSYDPLAYRVNSIEELDNDVRVAYLRKDSTKIAELTKQGQTDLDVFICVSHSPHTFVLCVPVGNNDPLGSAMFIDDHFDIPEVSLCWKFELCYQNIQLQTYKIHKEFKLFKDINPSVKRPYFIGTFKQVSPKALQFAALRAAPHQYNVLLNDCVEFSKEFCTCLLSYCANWKELEETVRTKIREASATGLRVLAHRKYRRPRSRPHLIDHIFGARITLILLFASLFY